MFETKDSGLLWVPQIPINWQVINLGRIGKFSSSGIDKLINENEVPVKIINYTDIYRNKNMILDSSIDYMEVTCKFDKRQNNLVKVGDIIFTPSSETIDEIGMSAVVYEIVENLSFSYHVLRYQPHIEICLSFKKYMLNNHLLYNYFSSRAAGTIRQTLNRHDFKIAPVILPPIEEQKLIASFLDQKCSNIDSIITDLENQIEILEMYKKSVITETVTKGLNTNVEIQDSGIKWIGDIPKEWKISRFKYLFQIKSSKRVMEEDWTTEGIPFYRAREIVKLSENGYVENDLFITNELFKLCARLSGTPKKGDILVTGVGTIGVSYLVPNNIDAFYFKDGNIIWFIPKPSVLSEYYNYLFKTDVIISQIKSMSMGSTVLTYTIINAKETIVPVPSYGEQIKIVEYLNSRCMEIDNIISGKIKQLEIIRKYKNSLIYEYVTGKKRVSQGDVNE